MNMNEENTYKEGDEVLISNTGDFLFNKRGIIRGISSTLPVVGGMYIVEFKNNISKDYQYSCVVLPESSLQTIKEDYHTKV